jgi:hypothetical protein
VPCIRIAEFPVDRGEHDFAASTLMMCAATAPVRAQAAEDANANPADTPTALQEVTVTAERRIVMPFGSAAIAVVAMVWLVQRAFFPTG